MSAPAEPALLNELPEVPGAGEEAGAMAPRGAPWRAPGRALLNGLRGGPGAGEEAGAIAPGAAPARGPAVPTLGTPPPTGGNAEDRGRARGGDGRRRRE